MQSRVYKNLIPTLNRTTLKFLFFVVVGVFLCSCATKSKEEANKAFMQGRESALQMQSQKFVIVKGRVMYPLIPWREGLTLAQAILSANYRGLTDPRYITVIRGEESVKLPTKTFLSLPEDIPLEPGDVIILE